MAAMGLCPQNKEVFDPIRKVWVEATPEEIVRQSLLLRMISELNYPRHLIAVEKELSSLPHLTEMKKEVPKRRLDIVCFDKQSHLPLLLIECKAIPLKETMLPQLLGYNAFVKAPYICLVNDTQIVFAGKDGQSSRLPQFETLAC